MPKRKSQPRMVQRNATDLAKTLQPLMGEFWANLIFGLGVFGMGFSTIIILMLINGFVFCEAVGKPDSVVPLRCGLPGGRRDRRLVAILLDR